MFTRFPSTTRSAPNGRPCTEPTAALRDTAPYSPYFLYSSSSSSSFHRAAGEDGAARAVTAPTPRAAALSGPNPLTARLGPTEWKRRERAKGLFVPMGPRRRQEPRPIEAPSGPSPVTSGPSEPAGSASMSRRGLSVYAAPFIPRAMRDSSALSVFPELPAEYLGDTPLLRDGQQQSSQEQQQQQQQQQQVHVTGSSISSATVFHRHDMRPSVFEFPRTPLTTDPRCALRSPLLSNSAVCKPFSASGSAEPMAPPQRLTPILATAVLTSPVMMQSAAAAMGIPSRSILLGNTTGCNSSAQCPTETTDGTDKVRQRRVPFTDAEAMDEATMIDLLHASSSGEEDEDEGATFLMLQQHQHNMANAGPGSSAGCNLYMCGGGYWDLEGPRAATRRYMRRVNSMILTSPTMETLHARENSHNTSFSFLDQVDVNEDHEELWEINSSAYADSLDEAQAEWIEEQLRAKENPEGFFF